MKTFFSRGKLLLTGEYLVLDGALSLALPTQIGQTLVVTPSQQDGLLWRSFGHDKTIWFEEKLFTQSKNPIAQTLQRIIRSAEKMNPNFVSEQGFLVETFLDFPQNWGLGSSSTLINCIAQWAEVDAYTLLFDSFGGSGYDIACAKAISPLIYQIIDRKPISYPVCFSPAFTEKIFFIHLNKKQNSREGIEAYKRIKKNKRIAFQITEITEAMLQNPSYDDFSKLLEEHEHIISQHLNLPKAKDLYFSDFDGTIKSLGAWGGDFILAIGKEDYVKEYFSKKGYLTILPFKKLIAI